MIKIDAATLLQMLNRVKKFAGTDNEFILNTVHIHKLPEIKKGMAQPHADGSFYDLRTLATVAGIAGQGVFIPQGKKKGLLVAEDCWAILMPLRSTGSNEHTQWDHFIKELTNG